MLTLHPASRLAATVAGTLLVLAQPMAQQGAPQAATVGATAPIVAELVQQQPAAFVPNLGQWQHPGRYVARLGAVTAFLEDDGFLLTFAGAAPSAARTAPGPVAGRPRFVRNHEAELAAAVRLQFVNAAAADFAALLPGSVRQNYFVGERSSWRTEVPTYGAVRYQNLYRGVDVRCYSRDGHFEYDLELATGADLAAVQIEVSGASGLSVDADGALVFQTAVGTVRQPAPVTWEVGSDGARRPITAQYRLLAQNRFGFAAPGWNGSRPLVVDPGVLYATTLGSVFVGTMAMDAAGVVTVVGDALGLAYPTTTGAYSPAQIGGTDWFVTQLDPSLPTAQQHRYTTYFGGGGDDSATEVAIAPNGVITIAGTTNSTNYPTTAGALQSTFQGGSIDGTVTRLDPSRVGLQQLVYATLLGGSGDDLPEDVTIGFSGELVVVGYSDSPNLPTSANCWDPTVSSGGSAFVTQLDPTLTGAQQLAFGTYLGGTASDDARAVEVDVLGRITVVGYAESTNFPTTPGAFQNVHASPIQADAFVAQLDPSQSGAQQLAYSSLFGGVADDWFDAVAIDALGAVITLVGTTGSANLAVTPNAYQTAATQPSNQFFGTFVVRLAPALGSGQLVYSSYLVGTGFDFAAAIVTTGADTITVTGGTDATDFPTTPGAYDRTNPAGNKAYVARLDLSRAPARQLVYSTYFGGGTVDYSVGMALDPADSYRVTLAGYVASPTFPTTPGAFGTPLSGSDLFVARLDLRPTGVEAYGASSPGCFGALPMGVLSWPQVGAANFTLSCSNAEPNALAALVIGFQGLAAPTPVLGVDVWVATTNAVAVVLVATPSGVIDVPFPIPAVPGFAGVQMFAQFGAFSQMGPAPCPVQGLAASNALHLSIQP